MEYRYVYVEHNTIEFRMEQKQQEIQKNKKGI